MTTDSTTAWLGLAALAIGALVRLLKTDALNGLLARLNVPLSRSARSLGSPWA